MRDEGSAVAGSDYTLICEITIPTFSHTITVSMPFVTWTYPSGEMQHTFGNSVQLVFSPLTSDDDGVYTCIYGLLSCQWNCITSGKQYFQ